MGCGASKSVDTVHPVPASAPVQPPAPKVVEAPPKPKPASAPSPPKPVDKPVPTVQHAPAPNAKTAPPKAVDHEASPTFKNWQPEELEPQVSNIPEMHRLIMSKDLVDLTRGANAFRRLLCRALPPIDKVIAFEGAVPRLVELAKHPDHTVKLEALWALTNLLSGNEHQTKQTMNAGVVPVCVAALSVDDEQVCSKALWALGNVCGSSTAARDEVLAAGAVPPALAHVAALMPHDGSKETLLHNACWMVSTICRGKPTPSYDSMKELVSMCMKMLDHWDIKVQGFGAWCIFYMTQDNPEFMARTLEAGLSCTRLSKLLSSADVMGPVLKVCGNIASGTQQQTQLVIDAHVLGKLPLVFKAKQSKDEQRRDVCWLISNVMSGPPEHIQAVIDAELVPLVMVCLSPTADNFMRKEAVWALANSTQHATPSQIRFLVSSGCIPHLCRVLSLPDAQLVRVAVEGLYGLMKIGEEAGASDVSFYTQAISSVKGFQALAAHKEHEDAHTRQQVTYLLSYQDIGEVMADTAEEELAAVKIQAALRGRQARKEVGELKEQTAAAVKIQAVHRGSQGRKKAASMKQEMRELEGDSRSMPSLRMPSGEPTEPADASSTDKAVEPSLADVERHFDRLLSIQADITGTAEEEAAAVKIQAVQRGREARKEVEAIKEHKEQEAAAVKIQAVQRGREDRKKVEQMRAGTYVEPPPAKPMTEKERIAAAKAAAQRAEEEEQEAVAKAVSRTEQNEVPLMTHYDGTAEEEAAAVKIQAVQRGREARKEVEAIKEHKEQEAAAVKIQAVQRGREARKEVQEIKAAKAKGVESSKPASEVGLEIVDITGTPEEEAAAVKIQAVQRGREARKEVEAIKEHKEQEAAAVKIQAVQRGREDRKKVEEMKASRAAEGGGAPADVAAES